MNFLSRFIYLIVFSGLTTIYINAQQQPIRLNCGGFKVVINGITFETDKYYTGTFAYRNYNIPDIFLTDLDSLYFSERGPDSNLTSFQYHIPVENGLYTLRLHFAEIYWGVEGGDVGGIGSRIFNVILEGNEILSNFDITKEAGVKTAIIKTFDVAVNDGVIDLDFIPIKNRGKISAIEVLPKNSQPLGVEDNKKSTDYNLSQNYPNPFNPTTNINFSIPSKSYVTLKIFDVSGKEVDELANSYFDKGDYNFEWNASGLPSGVYLYRLQASAGSASNFSESKKLLLMK